MHKKGHLYETNDEDIAVDTVSDYFNGASGSWKPSGGPLAALSDESGACVAYLAWGSPAGVIEFGSS